jgi:GDP-4-dehydro-6-deoxy-D-mannose reductase
MTSTTYEPHNQNPNQNLLQNPSNSATGRAERAFITGASGFVGAFLQEHLASFGDILATPTLEITDRYSLSAELKAFEPTVIYHLAGQANVGLSWTDPADTFKVNALGTLQLLESAAELTLKPRVIVVSSAEVYGRVDPKDVPISESLDPKPTTPYGSSKLAAEVVALQIARSHGLGLVVARPFNHIGPGQSDTFVVSGVARRIAEAERDQVSTITVGNLEAVRDFTDVRDVVAAYRLLSLHGKAGEIYNIGSGVGRTIASMIESLVSLSTSPLQLVADPQLMRPSDNPLLISDVTKLRNDTGWTPKFDPMGSLGDTLVWWRNRVGSNTSVI